MTYYNQDGLKSLNQQIRNHFFLNTPTISDTHVELTVGSTTVTVLSWLTQASLFPLAEKQTLWTHPPLPAPPNSAITCPKGILDPHGVGAGFSSTSLMYAENTLRNEHTNMIQTANKRFISMLRDIDSVTKLQYTKSHLHLKSHDPAARSTLFGCQSKLRTVERMGFLMCLLTHLKKQKNLIRPVRQNNQWSPIYQLWPTNHFQTQSSKRIWVVLRSPLQTCSPAETISQTWQHGWSWE